MELINTKNEKLKGEILKLETEIKNELSKRKANKKVKELGTLISKYLGVKGGGMNMTLWLTFWTDYWKWNWPIERFFNMAEKHQEIN